MRQSDMQHMHLGEAQYWARIGVLAAAALVLGYAETFIPLVSSVPGLRLGLANVIVLLALYIMDAKSAASIATIKVLATGLLFGSPLMMIYSIMGTGLAFAVMYTMKKLGISSAIVLSILGALFHNAGQLLAARIVLGTSAVLYIWPYLALAACVTGLVSGIFVRALVIHFEQTGLSDV